MPAIDASLFAISDVGRFGVDATEAMVRRIVRAAPGRVAVVLRERQLTALAYLKLARALLPLIRAHQQYLVTVDRLDLCWLAGADGLHLGGRALSCAQIRDRGEPALFLSTGWHQGETMPAQASAVWISPVAQPRKGRPPLAAGALQRAIAQANAAGAMPVALGGVEADDWPRLRDAGFRALAATAAAYRSPERLVERLAIG